MKLPDEIFIEKKQRKNELANYIIGKYGKDVYNEMKKSKVYCKYCKRTVKEWIFSKKLAIRHCNCCIDLVIAQEKKGREEGWLKTRDEIYVGVCYDCRHYKKKDSFCGKENMYINKKDAKIKYCMRWKERK